VNIDYLAGMNLVVPVGLRVLLLPLLLLYDCPRLILGGRPYARRKLQLGTTKEKIKESLGMRRVRHRHICHDRKRAEENYRAPFRVPGMTPYHHASTSQFIVY
jgi:hypothetical protein